MTPELQKDESRKSKYSRKSRNKKATVAKVDVSTNALNLIFEERMTSAEIEDKLLEMVELNLDSEEQAELSEKNMLLVKELVAAMVQQSTATGRASIKLVEDSPLSEMKHGLQTVIANYHAMVKGRTGITDKLKVVKELLEEYGGEEGLIQAMLTAKDSTMDLSVLEDELAVMENDMAALNKEGTSLAYDENDAFDRVQEAQAKPFAFMRPGVQMEIKNLEQKLLTHQKNRAQLREDKKQLTEDIKVKSAKLAATKESADFILQKKVLSVLDIGSEKFKDELSALAASTGVYIEDTEITLTEVRKQLEIMLKEADLNLTVNSNLREKVTILSNVLNRATESSSAALTKFKEKAESNTSDIDQLENERLSRVGDRFMKDVISASASTALIASKTVESEAGVQSFRNLLSNNLDDASDQQLLAVHGASVSGMLIVNQVSHLATMTQSVIAKGIHQNEAQATADAMGEEFARNVLSKHSRNQTIDSMTDVMDSISTALEDSNQDEIEVTQAQLDSIGELMEMTSRMADAAQESREVVSSVVSAE